MARCRRGTVVAGVAVEDQGDEDVVERRGLRRDATAQRLVLGGEGDLLEQRRGGVATFVDH